MQAAALRDGSFLRHLAGAARGTAAADGSSGSSGGSGLSATSAFLVYIF
jgi:hypothetical protein